MSGAALVIHPDVSRWEAWSPERVADLLADVEAPWYVAGGWAIDLSSVASAATTRISRSRFRTGASGKWQTRSPRTRSSSSPARRRRSRWSTPGRCSTRRIRPGCANRPRGSGGSTSSGSPRTVLRGSTGETSASACPTTASSSELRTGSRTGARRSSCCTRRSTRTYGRTRTTSRQSFRISTGSDEPGSSRRCRSSILVTRGSSSSGAASVIEIRIDEGRLVEWASHAIGTPSFTGEERSMAELMRETFLDLGLQVQWQEVEDGRPNVLGTLTGAGGGRASCSTGTWTPRTRGRSRGSATSRGSSRCLRRGRPAVRPRDLEHEGGPRCYVEAVHALADAGVRLRGDLLVAAVCGEIEKTQFGHAGRRVPRLRRRLALPSRTGGVADMCILGEPTESKVVLGTRSLWARSRPRAVRPYRLQRRAARGELDPAHARRARRGARVDP